MFSKLNIEKYYVAPFFFPLNAVSHLLFVYLLGKLDILLNVMPKALKYMREKKKPLIENTFSRLNF